MRTSEQIKAEIEEQLGFFPSLFSSAQNNSQVLENLWQQTQLAYINNPLSVVFKEKLCAYLSRYCAIPYCLVCHCCSLRPLGMKAQEILKFLMSPPPTATDIEKHLGAIAALPGGLKVLPEQNSILEASLLDCAIFIFLEQEQADTYKNQLRHLLGDVNYQHLIAFVAYVKTCHTWTEAYPQVTYESDKRVQEHLAALLEEEPSLADFFQNYSDRVKRERQSLLERQAEITKLQREQEEVLRQSEERLRLALEAGCIGIWDWNILSDEITCSDNMATIFGINPDTYPLGTPTAKDITYAALLECVHADDRESVNQQLMKAVETGTGYDMEFRIVLSDGTIQWAASKGKVWCDQDGKPQRLTGIDQNITARKQAEAERAQLLAREQTARSTAEAASRSKDEFLAIVSHELRSPLNAMLGWAQLLQTRKLDAATTNKALEAIERNARSQSQLVEDLLDISRITRGKLTLRVSQVNLVTVISAAIDAISLAAEAKAINFKFSILDLSLDNTKEEQSIHLKSTISNPQFLVSGDADRLQQVCWHLLSNAIKYTPTKGRVEIKLSTEGERQETVSSPVACIQVTDTGKGISAEFLPYIFDCIRQADIMLAKSHRGLGIGLVITRHLVEMHGGTIGVDSQGEGKGTTFTVKLPLLGTRDLVKTRESTPSPQPLAPSPASLSGLRVMVVDDEADVRDYIATVLEDYGAEAIAIARATQALEMLQQWKPHILISDIAMPEQDGYTFIRIVRKLPAERGGKIPAVAITAYASDEDRNRAITAGFQLHVPKPVEPSQLAAVVAQLTGRNK